MNKVEEILKTYGLIAKLPQRAFLLCLNVLVE